MSKSTIDVKTDLLSTSISAFNNAENATALLHEKYDALMKANILPSYFAAYFKKGGKNVTRNEDCTATKEQAEAITAEFLYHHKDRDAIVAFKAMTKSELGSLTLNQTKAFKALVKLPNSKRESFRKNYARYIDKADNAALKEKAKNDPNAAKELDEKIDNERRTKDLAALATILKRAPDTLEDGQMIDAKVAFKTLMDIYNS